MDRPVRVAAAATALLALYPIGLASQQATASAGRIMAAMVREDGVLVPFAEYRGDTWMLPGVELTSRATPWFNAPEPAPATWSFALSTGLRTLTAASPMKVDTHCDSYWGLSSDLPGTPGRANTSGRKVGVALSGTGGGETFAALKAGDANAARVVAYVRAQFDRAEAEAIGGTVAAHLSPPERAREPLTITRILQSRTRVDGQTLTFVEAVRKYPRLAPPEDKSCGLESVWQVWVVDDGGASLTLLNSVLTLTQCDHKEVASLAPLAVALVEGRWFIFAEERGYESERYVIFAVEPRAIVRRMSVWGGGC